MQEGPMPNLATREGQEAVAPLLEGIDLVIMDNLSTLARHGRSNDEESWLPVQGWLLELRRRGLSVFMIHHQGTAAATDAKAGSSPQAICGGLPDLDRFRVI
jgi:putative DNA primase/helicase